MQNQVNQHIHPLMMADGEQSQRQLANTLHFFSGRVRAVWQTKIFFSDQRNVAVLEVQDLYLGGQPATADYIPILEATISQVAWRDAPEFSSYVTEYPRDKPPALPFKLAGKRLWKAQYAWMGPFPFAIARRCKTDVACLPISYYTGKLILLSHDRILFGDTRNNVMVNLENFYIDGVQVDPKNMAKHHWGSESIIHSYVTKLKVIKDNPFPGPEPHLPTWPMGRYSSELWVAWYAWQGEMPMSVKHKAGRYHIIRMNKWDTVPSIPLTRPIDFRNSHHQPDIPVMSPKGNMIREATIHSVVPCSVPGDGLVLLKGGFLLGGQNIGLMSSHEAVIAFNKEVFYYNGKKLADEVSLDTFFKGKKIPLTALVTAFPKNKVLFNVKVPCYAVCVVDGNNHQQYEDLHKKCSKWEFDFETEETTCSYPGVPFTHFSGSIVSLFFASGVIEANGGLKEVVPIHFKRKSVYLYGRKFHSSCSLLDKKHTLDSTSWSVLAYPCFSWGNAAFEAIAVWQFHHQNFMDLLPLIHNEMREITMSLNEPSESQQQEEYYSNNGMNTLSQVQHEREGDRNRMHIEKNENVIGLAGYLSEDTDEVVGKLLASNTEECLLVSRRCMVLFSTKNLYINGKKYDEQQDAATLKSLPKQGARFSCSHLCPLVNPRTIFNCVVKMETSLVWVGVRPHCKKPHVVFDDKRDKEGRPSLKGYLFLHGTLRAQGIRAVLNCATAKGIIAVAVPSSAMLVNGRWLSPNSDIRSYNYKPPSYSWSALIYNTSPKVWCDETVKFQAAAVWEYGEHYNVINKLQDVLEKFPEVQSGEVCTTTSPRLTMNPDDELMFGWIVTVRNNWGVIRCTSEIPNVYVYVKFERSKVLSGEEKVGHRLPVGDNQLLQCSLNAAMIPVEEVDGFKVTMEASFVWLQSQLPSSAREINRVEKKVAEIKVNGVEKHSVSKLVKPVVNSSDSSSSPSKTNTVANGKLHAVEKDHKILNDDGTVNKAVRAKLTELGHKYIGKHVSGIIVKRCKGDGVARWKNSTHRELYIKFSHENIYVDMCSLVKKFKVADLESRACNFYVLPVPREEMAGYTVCLEATCGWIGNKPLGIPATGQQPFAAIDLPNFSTATCHSKISIEMPLISGVHKTVNNRIKMDSLSNGFENSLLITNGSSITTDSPSESGQDEAKGSSVWEDWERRSQHHQGKIIEVHSSMGRLETEDGTDLYFSRDHCYLYGVSLRNVELWHVLVQGDKVLYTGTELSPGTVRVGDVWVGSLSMASLTLTSARISEWCTNNLVPDGARETLMGQLELQVS